MAHDSNTPHAQDTRTYPAMPAIDFDAYLPYLEDEDIPEEQKRELIETLFGILMGFADIAFGISSPQNIWGKLAKIDSDSHFSPDKVLQLEDQKTAEKFKHAAKGNAP
ncbi:hypothetical protein [Kordiimonas sp.]|uniref:hypothetical protein n=1 Tax=Kordiimonas sp. TaxID=1970157 RepID=UPI003A90FEC7